MRVRIYKPARTAMQSGTRRTKRWRLDFEPEAKLDVEPLMGWTSSADTRRQIRLDFPTKEDAIAYAERHGLAYTVEDEQTSREKQIAYSDNFR